MDLTQIASMVGELTGKVDAVEKHFTNHLSEHKQDKLFNRIFMCVQTLIILGLFCFLKWGG